MRRETLGEHLNDWKRNINDRRGRDRQKLCWVGRGGGMEEYDQ